LLSDFTLACLIPCPFAAYAEPNRQLALPIGAALIGFVGDAILE
jgi:hypothetical protein